jgi:hypothetical protein
MTDRWVSLSLNPSYASGSSAFAVMTVENEATPGLLLGSYPNA